MKKSKVKGKTAGGQTGVSAKRLQRDKQDRCKSVSADLEDRKHGRGLREVQNKNSEKKLSDKKNIKTHKISNSRKLAKVSKFAIKEDKENKNIENKNIPESNKKDKDSVLSKSAETNHKHKKTQQSIEKININVESSDTPAEKSSDLKSTKRVSLKKKTDIISKESDSKTCEIKKDNTEAEKTPSKTQAPRNNYELRKRGRKSKKSMIYKDEDNIVYSCEKEEDMQKLDDSEFKLPNESHSKNLHFTIY